MAEVIIDLRVQGQQQADKLDTSLQKLDKTAKAAQDNIEAFAKKVIKLYATFKSLEFAYNLTIKTGLEYNRALEQQQQSISILIAATSKNVDSLGNQITAQQKFTMASKESVEVMKELERINASLPTTLKETADIYKAILPSFRQLGTSQEDLIKITEKLAIVQNVSGIETANFLASVDGLATGGVMAASDLGRFLEALGLSNKTLKESKDVAKLVLDKFKEFKTLDNYATATSNLEDEWTKLQGTLTQDIFVTQKESVKELTTLIHNISADTDTVNGIKDSINGFATGLISLGSGIAKTMTYAQYTIRATSLLLDAFGQGSQIVAAEIQQYFTEAFFNINKNITGLVGEDIASKLGLTALSKDNSVLLARNKVEFLKLELQDTSDAYRQLTNNSFKTIDAINLTADGLLNVVNNTKDVNEETKTTLNIWEIAEKKAKDAANTRLVSSEKAKELTAQELSALKETKKAYEDLASIGMSSYEKKIYDINIQTQSWIEKGVLANDALAKQKILLDELNQAQLKENTLSDLSYYERKVQLLDDEYAKQVELSNISYSRSILEIEATDKTVKEKESLIAKESELYELTLKRIDAERNTEFQDTMSTFYDDMLQSQIELNEAVFDFGAGYGESLNQIGKVSKSLAAMGSLELKNKREASALDKKYITQFNKYAGDVEKTKILEQQYTEDTALLNEQYQTAQMQGYANIAGAISGMFKQGSKEAATFQIAQTALALVEGTRAILTAGTGDPYTAIPRMAAMAIMVKSLLGNIGVALGIGGSSTSGDSFSMQTANNGTGSALGDTKKASESLTNAMKTLEDFAEPQYKTLQSMDKYLKNIANAIGGVSSLLVRNADFATGASYSGGFDTGFSNNLKIDNLLNPINSLISKIPVIGQINGLFGNILNSVLGGVFGKKSVSQSLKDSGITFANALLGNAIKEFNGSAYQTIETTVKKKSFFGSSSSTSFNTIYQDLDNGLENQFSLVLENLYNTVKESGNALGLSSSSLDNSLNNFVVSIGKISLKDKTGEQIQELLTNVFGKVGDDLAKATIPSLGGFQQVGEGLFETLTRVATGIQEAEYYIDRLGSSTVKYTDIINQQGIIGFEALSQSIIKLDSSLYGANNGVVQMIDNMNSTTEELYNTYLVFQDIRDVITLTGQSASNLSSAMVLGAGSIDKLKQSADSYFDNFLTDSEQQQALYSQLEKEFTKLNITMPKSVQGFKTLIAGIDTSTDSGAKLYGGLLSLSDSFSEVFGTAAEIENQRLEQISNISQSLTSVIEKLRGASSGAVSTLGDFYNSMRESKNLLFSGDLTSFQNSISKTIDLSNVLNDTKNFSSAWEMASQQAIAANDFEAMNMTLETEKDILDDIKTNTAITAAALSSVSSNPQQLLQQVQSNQNTTLPTTTNTNNTSNTTTTVSALVDMVQLLKTEIKSMVSVLNAIASSNQEIANSVEL